MLKVTQLPLLSVSPGEKDEKMWPRLGSGTRVREKVSWVDGVVGKEKLFFYPRRCIDGEHEI